MVIVGFYFSLFFSKFVLTMSFFLYLFIHLLIYGHFEFVEMEMLESLHFLSTSILLFSFSFFFFFAILFSLYPFSVHFSPLLLLSVFITLPCTIVSISIFLYLFYPLHLFLHLFILFLLISISVYPSFSIFFFSIYVCFVCACMSVKFWVWNVCSFYTFYRAGCACLPVECKVHFQAHLSCAFYSPL